MAIPPQEALQPSIENRQLVFLIEELIDRELAHPTKEPLYYANGSFEIWINGKDLLKPFAEIPDHVFHAVTAKYTEAGWKTMLTTVLIGNQLLVRLRK